MAPRRGRVRAAGEDEPEPRPAGKPGIVSQSVITRIQIPSPVYCSSYSSSPAARSLGLVLASRIHPYTAPRGLIYNTYRITYQVVMLLCSYRTYTRTDISPSTRHSYACKYCTVLVRV